jgi:hypothetical protein
MATFKYIQNVYLDPSLVKNSAEAGITRVDLFFRGKPNATGNKSGIENPGVEVSIVPVVNGIPNINETDTIRPTEPTEHGARFAPRYEIARAEWGEIVPTVDASIATPFIFANPMWVKTGVQYGILVKYDGNEDFVLWYSKQNDPLLNNTTKLSPGSSDKNVGNFFTFVSSSDGTVNPTAAAVANSHVLGSTNVTIPDLTPDGRSLQTIWKPVSGLDLKFKLYVSRYAHGGVFVAANSTILNDPNYSGRFSKDNIPVSLGNGITRLIAPCQRQEYVKFEIKDSNISSLYAGSKIYQDAPNWPGGKANPLTISTTIGSPIVVANGSYVLNGGNTFAASNGFFNVYGKSNAEFIVIKNGANVNIRQVKTVINSTALLLDRQVAFTNSVAQFALTTVGSVAGISDSYISGVSTDVLILSDSNANSSVRFVNNQILSISPTAGGTGYSNTDYIEVSGFESVANKVIGGYKATANLVTNSSGGVQNIYMANLGCGFVNPDWVGGANVAIKNANGANSSGSGLTLSYTYGANLVSEVDTSTYFGNCEIMNLEASRIKPEITVNNPLGTAFTVSHKQLFYSQPDSTTFSGKAYRIYDDSNTTIIPVKIFKSHDTGAEDQVSSMMPSRSNQFIVPFANGALGNSSIIGGTYSNAAVYYFDVSSNNDYMAPFFEPDIINSHYSKYNINNDYTNEHTNYGNAYAKHVATKVTFNTERQAEDLLVYLTAYRPLGTDIKVYARIHNRTDNQAFDDEDWSLLDLIDGNDVYSSATDDTNFIEYTYGFAKAPNTDITMSGTVTIDDENDTTITGAGTLFNTEIAAGDMIKVTQPLFQANSYALLVVNSIANDTSMTVQTGVGNTGLIGSGLVIEKVHNFKHQAFSEVINDNIVSYYNEDMTAFSTYDTFQLKLVMLSNNESVVPKIDDVRAVGTTA